MVETISRQEEQSRLNSIFSELEVITKKIYPDSVTSDYQIGASHTKNENKRFIYTRGIVNIPDKYANEIEVTIGLGPNKISIEDQRAYRDALQLAQAFENHLVNPFRLYTP